MTVEDGPNGPEATKLRGNPEHPFSQGELCPKVNRFLDRVYSPERILTPLRRCGPKGSTSFEPISWDVALLEISTRWKSIIEKHGAESIVPFSSAGNQSALAMTAHERFTHRVGMSRLVDSICGLTAGAGTAVTYGTGKAADPMEIEHATCIVLWGTNPRLTNRHLWPFVERARAAGAKVVTIDPLRTITADSSDWFLQPLPGTDVALMLGLAHIWIRDQRIDKEYIELYADGFESFAEEAKAWDPIRVASTCGLSVEDIEALADLTASSPVTHFRTVIGAEHRERGGDFFRVLSILPVLIGAWRHRGGGYSRSVGVYTLEALSSPRISVPPSSLPKNLASSPRSLSMNHLGRWLTDPLDPPVHSVLLWNANPLVTNPNAELIRRGLAREDLFTVIHEQFLTDTAMYADIILPATTQLESVDVVPSWGSPHLNWNHAAIEPRGECVSNTELFRRLAQAMGYHDDLELMASDDELLDQLFDSDSDLARGITRQRLEEEGTIRLNLPVEYRPYAHGGFATASSRAQLADRNGLAPTYIPAIEGPSGPHSGTYPLSLMTPKVHTRFLNASYAHLPQHGGREGGPYIEMHTVDATERGINDGDLVRVWNERSSLQLCVRIGSTVRPGVVSVPFGWHGAAAVNGRTANSLTNDVITNAGVGVGYLDTMVEVQRTALVAESATPGQ